MTCFRYTFVYSLAVASEDMALGSLFLDLFPLYVWTGITHGAKTLADPNELV